MDGDLHTDDDIRRFDAPIRDDRCTKCRHTIESVHYYAIQRRFVVWITRRVAVPPCDRPPQPSASVTAFSAMADIVDMWQISTVQK
ncbi:hypothetical protein [Amycolatopsis lurida]|uniref:hypothetical protein n=1 Tax=Amycolatopsis lurida TaxID=31959 RepID=UPI0018EA17CA|nr:hypothetical protein [Amycolatopsis lurida]